MGWQRDLKDFRDFEPGHAAVRKLLWKLERPYSRRRRLPTAVDLREYFPPARDQASLNTSTAFAVLALVEYFEARTCGRLLGASRLFLYQLTLKLLRLTGNASADLRTTFKALARCGSPPEPYWPYGADRFHLDPADAFLFAFAREYEAIRYFRLDAADGATTLRIVKAYLAAGFVAVFGFSVPSTLTIEGDIEYRPKFGSIRGGHAVLAVGFDDSRRIASDTGALLFRNSWGAAWGDDGYGWLPYKFVTNQLATDFWTAIKRDWVGAAALARPES
ncbi:MAG TPA: C1 family peptidase [Gemmataceae bacterium]|jgi:C1A family cysteine protease|nr:C1 family peptidase [Gemmataceae bacterium]